ncbi:MAG: hypothetical protein NT085_01950 [candidate division SR1 bacterium]|nr:hypothetical protein [candidate division SR1 bacterium]
MEKDRQKEHSPGFKSKLQYFLMAAALSAVLHLSSPAQNKIDEDRKVHKSEQPKPTKVDEKSVIEVKDAKEKKEIVNEWNEFDRIRGKIMIDQKYGSDHLMTYLDGAYSTSQEYRELGNSFLELLYNLGYRADEMKVLPCKKVPGTQSFPLGFIKQYNIGDEKVWIDSIADQKSGHKVAANPPHYSIRSHLIVDSSKYEVNMGGFTSIKDKKTISMPPMYSTGGRRDWYDYDQAYEFMMRLFDQHKDEYDITKRQMSNRVPSEVADFITRHFNTQQYYQNNKISQWKQNLSPNLVDNNGIEYIIPGTYFKVLRYFGDVYRTEMVSDGKNPLRENAFENPDEANKKYLMLNYGMKGYIMPTVINPKMLKTEPAPLNGAIETSLKISTDSLNLTDNERDLATWKLGSGYSAEVEMKIYMVNGRVLKPNLYEYRKRRLILPLNRDGPVDGVYIVYSPLDDEVFGAYGFCSQFYDPYKHYTHKHYPNLPYNNPYTNQLDGKPGRCFLNNIVSLVKQWRNDSDKYRKMKIEQQLIQDELVRQQQELKKNKTLQQQQDALNKIKAKKAAEDAAKQKKLDQETKKKENKDKKLEQKIEKEFEEK